MYAYDYSIIYSGMIFPKFMLRYLNYTRIAHNIIEILYQQRRIRVQELKHISC